jgi:uncharacterized protein YkwD
MQREVVRLRPLLIVLAVAAATMAAPATGERGAAAEQKALDARLLTQVNAVRARYGLRPLRRSPALSTAAARHSIEMAQQGYFSHASVNGTAYWKRIRRFYSAAGFRSWSVGENLAWKAPRMTAAEVVRMWMASATHRANLLDPSWRELGVSAVRSDVGPGYYRGLPVTVVTADFGLRARSS